MPWTYVTSDFKVEKVVGKFYEKELKNPDQKERRVLKSNEEKK